MLRCLAKTLPQLARTHELSFRHAIVGLGYNASKALAEEIGLDFFPHESEPTGTNINKSAVVYFDGRWQETDPTSWRRIRW